MSFTKTFPYIVVLIALASLVLQYRAYQASAKDCGCEDKTPQMIP